MAGETKLDQNIYVVFLKVSDKETIWFLKILADLTLTGTSSAILNKQFPKFSQLQSAVCSHEQPNDANYKRLFNKTTVKSIT